MLCERKNFLKVCRWIARKFVRYTTFANLFRLENQNWFFPLILHFFIFWKEMERHFQMKIPESRDRTHRCNRKLRGRKTSSASRTTLIQSFTVRGFYQPLRRPISGAWSISVRSSVLILFFVVDVLFVLTSFSFRWVHASERFVALNHSRDFK